MEKAITTSTEECSTPKPSFAVVKRIADLEETRPEELTPPLYSAIDPEALDALFDSTADRSLSAGQISFTYCDYDVCVRSDGEIAVTES